MAGPNCTLEWIEKTKHRPPTWLVVCRCGKTWRVIGPKDRAEQTHYRHRNAIERPSDFPSPFREALEAIGKIGLDGTIVDETDQAADESEIDHSDRTGDDDNRRRVDEVLDPG